MGGLGVQMAMAVDNALLWDKSNAGGAFHQTHGIFSSSPRRCRRLWASSSARSKKTAFDDADDCLSCKTRLGRASSSGKSGAVSAGRLGSLSSQERREDDAIFWDKQKLCEAVDRLELAEAFVSSSSYVRLLRACGELKALEEGTRVHAHIGKRGLDKDLFVRYALIRMYLKCRGGSGLADARHLFFGMQRRDVVIWTEMIAAHARIGQCDAALELYQRMRVEGVMPNKVTFLTLLSACACPGKLSEGRLIHSRIVEQGLDSDVAVSNALMKMYVSCGSLADARRKFETMAERDVVSWTTMVVAYGQEGMAKEALKFFKGMLVEGVKPDEVACVAVLNACATGMELAEGRWIHHDCIVQGGFQSNVVVASNLVNMYGKCGSLDEARAVFDKCPRENVVLWTAMIAAYAQNGHCEALHLFRKMQLEGIRPNRMTFATVMNSCAGFAALSEGKMIHALIDEAGLEWDAIVGNSIVTMYGKCGNLGDAQRMFDIMPVKEANTWNAMITAYAQHGHYEEALELFRQMQQLGENPNNITLVGVLSACAHGGLVDDGCKHFVTMEEYFGIKPSMQHYGCMVDLLGRAGWLKEAEEFIKRMPFQPDAAVWTALFGACRTHGDLERGKRAARRVLELEPDNTGMHDFLTAESYAGTDSVEATGVAEGDDSKEVYVDLKADEESEECATAADNKEASSVEAVEATEHVEVDKICATGEGRQESAIAVYQDGDAAAEEDNEEESNLVEATVVGYVVEAGDLREGSAKFKSDETEKHYSPVEAARDDVVEGGDLGEVSTDLQLYEDTQQCAAAMDEDDKHDEDWNPVGSTVEEGVSADEDTQRSAIQKEESKEDDDKESSPECVVESDERLTGLKSGEEAIRQPSITLDTDLDEEGIDAFDHAALAKKVLWLTVMTVVIRGSGVWSVISGMHHQATC